MKNSDPLINSKCF